MTEARGVPEGIWGKCHICRASGEIAYCSRCGHWFDSRCREAWFSRGLEWIKELVGGKRDGCCGPEGLKGDLR